MYTIVIDYLINFYLLEPVIKLLLSKNADIYIACKRKHYDFISGKVCLDQKKFIYLDDIQRKYKILFYLHRVLLSLITPQNFSWQYYKKISNMTLKFNFRNRVIYKAARIFPKVRKQSINSFLTNIFSFIIPKVFPTTKIIVSSLNEIPELLCTKKYNVITIMESWDHPVKMPNGYKSALVITWNPDLASDWKEFQGDENVKPVFPLKMRYASEKLYKTHTYNSIRKKANKCVYAVASTSKFSAPKLVEIERKILHQICNATKNAGWSLLIKPRPHGTMNEFDDFLNSFTHITIGTMKNGADIAANYYLDDEYNNKRFSEVIDSDLIINCFTTFGLDSASAGIPVLQLDVRKATGLEDSTIFYDNYHIKKYLINNDNILRVENNTLSNILKEYLENPDSRQDRYSEDMREWLCIDKDYNKSLEEIYEIISGL